MVFQLAGTCKTVLGLYTRHEITKKKEALRLKHRGNMFRKNSCLLMVSVKGVCQFLKN